MNPASFGDFYLPLNRTLELHKTSVKLENGVISVRSARKIEVV